jgi:hypothetical protein
MSSFGIAQAGRFSADILSRDICNFTAYYSHLCPDFKSETLKIPMRLAEK